MNSFYDFLLKLEAGEPTPPPQNNPASPPAADPTSNSPPSGSPPSLAGGDLNALGGSSSPLGGGMPGSPGSPGATGSGKPRKPIVITTSWDAIKLALKDMPKVPPQPKPTPKVNKPKSLLQ